MIDCHNFQHKKFQGAKIEKKKSCTYISGKSLPTDETHKITRILYNLTSAQLTGIHQLLPNSKMAFLKHPCMVCTAYEGTPYMFEQDLKQETCMSTLPIYSYIIVVKNGCNGRTCVKMDTTLDYQYNSTIMLNVLKPYISTLSI